MTTYRLPTSQMLIDFNSPLIMGVLNLTPDSFYKKSRIELDKLGEAVEQMIDDGVDIIDLGAMSSRPGAIEVSSEEEIQRLLPALEHIRQIYPKVPISVDTYRSEVVKAVAEVGIDMINDITAGLRDEKLFSTVAQSNLPYVMMHMKGTPANMQSDTHYDDLNLSLLDFFSKRIHQAKSAGIYDIILDPGIGFGKSITDNFKIIKHLKSFQLFDLPILIGLSRKSFIYKTLETTPEDALNGTTAMHMLALLNGAKVLRVHDVKEAVECKKLYKSYVE